MSRRRQRIVHESQSELEQRLRQSAGTPDEVRLRFLCELVSQPELELGEIATRLEYSDRQVRRWWSAYRRGGLDALLINGDHDVPVVAADVGSERLLAFMNSMPMSLELEPWLREFKPALERLLPDVDKAMICIDIAAAIRREEVHEYKQITTRGIEEASGRKNSMRSSTPPKLFGEAFVEHATANGLPAHEFREPLIFDYFLNRRYLGSIVLWRLRTNPPIDKATLALLRSLERFISFALLDCIARCQEGRRDMFHFQNALLTLGTDFKLSAREMEVFALQIVGRTRSSIAEELCVAESTVSKHIGNIHRKIGTGQYIEAFSRIYQSSDAPFGK